MEKLALRLIYFYQKYFFILRRTFCFSPSLCRFTPTCSQYTYEAISRYGIIKGVWRGLWRLARCHPFSKGGIDLLN